MNCPRCGEACWRDEHSDGPGYGAGKWCCTPCQWQDGDDPDPSDVRDREPVRGRRAEARMSKPKKVKWLHMVSWAGMFAYPCEVLSQGEQFATIKLLHQAVIGRERLKRGAIKRRVPLCALQDAPGACTYVSKGAGRFRA